MSKTGIDVSYHQSTIDWKKVAKSGIEFAMIRAGYGKSTVDKKFVENITGANTAGLKLGVYWFIYALNEKEAIENADKCHETIKLYKDIIELGVAADYEYDSDSYSLKKGVVQTKESRTRIVKAFLERLKHHGYKVLNYANPDYINSKFEPMTEYPVWLAWYNANEIQAEKYNPAMFQYTSKGNVPGINGSVDMNIYYGEFENEKTSYYPIPSMTLIDALNYIGVDSSYNNRLKIAQKNNIGNPYKGTAEQNKEMLNLLNKGKLKK